MKQTIAQKKANGEQKRRKLRPLTGLLSCIPFAAIAYFCKYVFPGYSFTTLVCCCIVGVILFYSLMPLVGAVFPGFARVVTRWFTVLLILGLIVCGTTEAFVIKESFGDPQDTAPYMIVLGAKVRPDGPSVSLQDRIDKAYEYMTEHPEVIAVVSGGQGNDEIMTEAQCMFDHLTAMGIAPERVWMEDKATSTDENLRLSLDLIQERTGQRPTKIGILSSEYHMLRSKLMAKKLGLECVGVPARTSRLSQLINHGMREVAGIWHFFIFGR